MRRAGLGLAAALTAACGGGGGGAADAPLGPDAGGTPRTRIGGVDVVETRALVDDGSGGLTEQRTARVSAEFFSGGPANFHRHVMTAGACTLRSYAPASCDPACADGLCVDTDTCEPWPTRVSAGALAITGLTAAVSITPVDGYYVGDALPEDLFADAAVVTADLAGADLPPATLVAGGVAPLVTAITDRITLVPGEDHVVGWTPGGGGRVRLTLNSNNQGHGGPYLGIIECEADDAAGQLTVPAALVDAFPETRAWTVCAGSDCPPSRLRRFRASTAPIGVDQAIELAVASEQTFGVDHILPD